MDKKEIIEITLREITQHLEHLLEKCNKLDELKEFPGKKIKELLEEIMEKMLKDDLTYE